MLIVTPQIMASCENGPTFINRLGPLYPTLMYPLLFPMGDASYSFLYAKRHDKIFDYDDPYRGLRFNTYMRQRLLRDFSCYDRLAQAFAAGMLLVRQDRDLQWYSTPVMQCKVHHLGDFTNQKEAAEVLKKRPEQEAHKKLAYGFEGHPAHMKKLYHESLAVMAKHGAPTYMITMTPNAHWPEVQQLPLQQLLQLNGLDPRQLSQPTS